MATEDAVSYYRERLIEEIELGSLAGLTADQRRARVERVVGRLVSREGPMLSSTDRGALIRWVVDESVGLGVLEPLLADHTVTEIMVNGADSIWVERQGRLEVTDARFSNVEQLLQTIDRIVSRVNRRVDESSPMVDARLPTGERVNVIIPPLSLRGPAMTIRRFPRTFTLARLVAGGAMDEVTAQFLATCVRSRLNLVISGGTGAGKDHVAQRDVGLHPRARARDHHRGQRGAPAPARPRASARGTSGQRRGPRPGHHPRPGPQLPSHAPRPHHRRRGARARDARHAPGHEHGPRGLAGDGPLQHGRGRAAPPRHAGDDERARHPVRGAARADQLRHPHGRPTSIAIPTAAASSPRSAWSPRRGATP